MKTHINGIDIIKLAEAAKLFEQQPQLAQFKFCADSDWIEGGHSKIQIQRFVSAGVEDKSREQPFIIECDEPGALLGSNKSPNPVELVLASIISCLSVGFAYSAAARGILIESLKFHAEGDIDVRGFLGLAENVRPGYQRIKLVCNIKADASEEQLNALKDYVIKTSPVMDVVNNMSSVSMTLKKL